MFGISVESVELSKTRYDPDEVWQRVLDACASCQGLIRIWGGRVENFVHSPSNGDDRGSLWMPSSPSVLSHATDVVRETEIDSVSNIPLKRCHAASGECEIEQVLKRRKERQSGTFRWVRSAFSR